MRKQSHEQVSAAARRRLELLGRELDQAGLRRVEELDPPRVEVVALPEAAPVAPVGRHLRPPRPGPARRAAAWLGDQVPETLRGRVGLEPGPVLLVVALVALSVTAAALVVLRMGGDASAVPRQGGLRAAAESSSPLVRLSSPGAAPRMAAGVSNGRSPGSPGAPQVSDAAGGAAAGADPKPGASVTVDVAGRVRRPGVTTLPAGSRVIDALRQAGGSRARVDLTALNLARVLVDGEQIVVGRTLVPGGAAASASTAAPDPAGGLVNLNTATAEQLDTLPGVGPVTAQKILEWRAGHGAFSSVDELLEVDGIGDKTLADLAPHVTL